MELLDFVATGLIVSRSNSYYRDKTENQTITSLKTFHFVIVTRHLDNDVKRLLSNRSSVVSNGRIGPGCGGVRHEWGRVERLLSEKHNKKLQFSRCETLTGLLESLSSMLRCQMLEVSLIRRSLACVAMAAAWCSGNTSVSINVVALHWARLLLGWIIVYWRENRHGMYPIT